MNIHLDPSGATFFWLALSLVICTLAAQLALAWVELMPGKSPSSRRQRLAGAGVSLGMGIWSTQAMVATIGPAPLTGAAQTAAALAICLFAGMACIAPLAWPPAHTPPRSSHWLAGCMLALGVVALQALAISAGGRDSAAIAWRWHLLFAAFVTCGLACVAAVGLCVAARRGGHGGHWYGRLGGGALIGAGVVLGQYLVLRAVARPATDLPDPVVQNPGYSMAAIALLGTLGVLFVSKQLLHRRLRAEAERIAARREREAQSPKDPLTGLPTRQLFEGVLAQAVQLADASQQRLALLFINLDGFKSINESFGHVAGDQVLREVAKRLRALSLPHMTARMSGDEFLMLLTGNPQGRDASALVAGVIAALGAPYPLDGREATLSCSIGVAMYPEHGAKSTVIVHAHAAMAAAKAAGGASHAFFEERMIKGMRDDVELLRDLRSALDRKQLELYYQPKIHTPSGEITGAEALLRWNHPQRGVVSPALFIPIAERYGLINAIGRWVIDETCRQSRAWRDEGLRMRVAINLSVHQLRQPDLAAWLRTALKRHQVNPDLITCEVTESSAMDDTETTTRVLGELDRIGVHISIDDFGTGHSSLAYLRKLPADELKIDRSFVMDLETSEEARKVAVAVINLAKALDLKVVAEGVETEAQNRILREFGCDQLQGYLFAKPMSAKALALWATADVGPRALNFRKSLFSESTPNPVT